MDPEVAERQAAKARQYSSDYYYRNQEEVRKKRIVALIARGHTPKPSTLERYQLQVQATN